MTNPFERFHIDHLSPSSLNTYGANPSLWVGKYLMGWKDPSGPSAMRGTAVEAGLDSWLFERDPEKAIQAAFVNFALNTEGLDETECDAERANLEPMLLQAIAKLKDSPIPVARQLRIECWLDGIEVPVIGYIDYLFEDHGLDLKTTKACPSSIRNEHGRQVATYSRAKQKPFSLLYVTPKRGEIYPLTDNEAAMHIRDVERLARAVRHLLQRSENARDAARFFAPETSDYRWSEKTRALADELYRPL